MDNLNIYLLNNEMVRHKLKNYRSAPSLIVKVVNLTCIFDFHEKFKWQISVKTTENVLDCARERIGKIGEIGKI